MCSQKLQTMNRIIVIGSLALLLLKGAFASSSDCPANQPGDFSSCSPLLADVTCEYGQLCCGDHADGPCVHETNCYCNGEMFTCYDSPGASLACPEMCPEVPPTTNDSCDIDYRYQCVYGDAFVCDDTGETFDYEKECSCDNGLFYCNSNACSTKNSPVPCPLEEPVHGSDCSPFLADSCSYGEYCCPTGEGQDEEGESAVCVPEKICYCDVIDLKTYCYEPVITCPSACPATKPLEGSACDIPARLYCGGYAPLGTCLEDDFVVDVSCTCVDGSFTCHEYCMGPPVSAPVNPPTTSGTTSDDDDQVPDAPPVQEQQGDLLVEEQPAGTGGEVIVPTSSPSQDVDAVGTIGMKNKNAKNTKKNAKMKGDKKDKNKMNSRKLGNRRIRGGSGDLYRLGKN